MFKSVEELKQEVKKVSARIEYYTGKVNTLQSELAGIQQRIYKLSVQEMTIEEIEAKLGHKIKIK